MKEHILCELKEKNKNLPKNLPYHTKIVKSRDYADVLAIFNSEDEDTDFLGFEVCYLDQIFNDTFDENYVFSGFDVCNLEQIFDTTFDEKYVFLGFDVCNLKQIFDTTFDENYEFLGF